MNSCKALWFVWIGSSGWFKNIPPEVIEMICHELRNIHCVFVFDLMNKVVFSKTPSLEDIDNIRIEYDYVCRQQEIAEFTILYQPMDNFIMDFDGDEIAPVVRPVPTRKLRQQINKKRISKKAKQYRAQRTQPKQRAQRKMPKRRGKFKKSYR